MDFWGMIGLYEGFGPLQKASKNDNFNTKHCPFLGFPLPLSCTIKIISIEINIASYFKKKKKKGNYLAAIFTVEHNQILVFSSLKQCLFTAVVTTFKKYCTYIP